MAGVATLNGSNMGTALEAVLMCNDIEVGGDPSYELCKIIYLYHPLGGKMVERPVQISMSQPRDLTIDVGPKERLLERFRQTWIDLNVDTHIFDTMRNARTYGISSVIYGAVDVKTDEPIDPWDLPKLKLYFNVFDPLNTAGSLVLNQMPNSPDFQKVVDIRVQGQRYHRSRSCVMMNESPIYIAYSGSAYGYVGRSVYQRALFPLKSYVQTMKANDLVARKVGVFIAKIKQVGSILDNLQAKFLGLKRSIVQEAKTNNVISVGIEEDIQTLNMQGADAAITAVRKNIIEDIASADGMPAQLLLNQTFADGFGEGSEDAKMIANYVDGFRVKMKPLYDFFDLIVMHCAWDEDFYESLKAEFPDEMNAKTYKACFYEWKKSFKAEWPSLLTEPDSDKVGVDKEKLEAIVSLLETLKPDMDPENKAVLIKWAIDNVNEAKLLFKVPLELDYEALAKYSPPDAQSGDQAGGEVGADGGSEAPADVSPPAPKPKKLAAI